MLLGLAAFLTAPPPAAAETNLTRAIAKLDDAKSGSLLIRTQDGGFADANRLGIDVDLKVSGPTVRAKVTQIFRNPTQDWVEAVYVYPLPEGSAVDTLKMVIGDRIVVGDIKEREKARAIYEQARRDGQKAALTEQERPNIFTNSVANIGPGETVLVQIEYQEPVKRNGEQFSLRVPMVIGPRYNPKPIVQTVDLRNDGQGWGATVNDPVPDRNRITPPVLDPSRHAPVESDQHHRAAAGGLSARRGEEPPPSGEDRQPGRGHAHHQAVAGAGAGGSRFRTDLDGGSIARAVRRPVPRARRRTPTTCSPPSRRRRWTTRRRSRCRAR